MPGALEDVRIIDFTHVLNGPFCTMLLGHLGAEIIKIEPPAGDSFRHIWMPKDAEHDGWEFLAVNTNKKSVVLDLKKKSGLDLARQLIACSDVLVENFGLGTMERFGLDYDSVKPLNPRLIYACSRGYGGTGPYASYGNNAGTNNGMAGWTHTAWEYNGAAGTKALGIGDEAAGVSMALGILAALHARERNGEGQRIEVSMQEAVLGFMTSSMHEFFTGNKVGTQPFKVADGYFTLRTSEVTDEGWGKLARLMGRDELVEDSRFNTATARRQHSAEVNEILRAWAKTHTRQEVWDGLRDLGYFGGPILSMSEVIEDPHVQARGAFVQVDHPAAGPATLVAPWIHLSETPTSIHDPAPGLGQHTDVVLAEVLGLGADQIRALHEEGAVQ
ncbi:MAG TPA: CoA transferase [Chloroflexota bacterium]|jgi:crotonobetainyl-CoA:carnitine CoA-transferase CaiB-like acyl-CoA transferase